MSRRQTRDETNTDRGPGDEDIKESFSSDKIPKSTDTENFGSTSVDTGDRTRDTRGRDTSVTVSNLNDEHGSLPDGDIERGVTPDDFDGDPVDSSCRGLIPVTTRTTIRHDSVVYGPRMSTTVGEETLMTPGTRECETQILPSPSRPPET